MGRSLISVVASIFEFWVQIFLPLSRRIISGDITEQSRATMKFKKGELVFETNAAKKQCSASSLGH